MRPEELGAGGGLGGAGGGPEVGRFLRRGWECREWAMPQGVLRFQAGSPHFDSLENCLYDFAPEYRLQHSCFFSKLLCSPMPDTPFSLIAVLWSASAHALRVHASVFF